MAKITDGMRRKARANLKRSEQLKNFNMRFPECIGKYPDCDMYTEEMDLENDFEY